jgi:L-idonate 5-dehydrogenase
MSDHCIAATLFGPEDLRLIDTVLPPLAPEMVRVNFGAGGICGSDMHYFRHGRVGDFMVKAPLVLGHEIAGTIAAVGEKVSGLKVGTRVAVNPSRWCGHCRHCVEKRPNLCENIYFMGSASKTPHMAGGFATSFDATPAQCVPIPDHVSFAAAALCEPLAVCLHAVARAGKVAGKRGLVIGAGPIGILTLMAAQAQGMAEVAVADIAASPLEFAARTGASGTYDLGANPEALDAAEPFDVVFEASGAPAGLNSAIRATRRGGTVVLIGSLPGGQIPAMANAVMAREIDLLGSFRFSGEFYTAVEMIASGKIDVTRIISAERPLREAPDAVRLALDRARSMKVVLVNA